LLDRWFPELETNFVGVNDEAVGMMATEHLIEIGCRNIAHICGTHAGSELARLKGYRQALSRRRIAVNPEYIVGAVLDPIGLPTKLDIGQP
jgi:LacI family transcriptional regulator